MAFEAEDICPIICSICEEELLNREEELLESMPPCSWYLAWSFRSPCQRLNITGTTHSGQFPWPEVCHQEKTSMMTAFLDENGCAADSPWWLWPIRERHLPTDSMMSGYCQRRRRVINQAVVYLHCAVHECQIATSGCRTLDDWKSCRCQAGNVIAACWGPPILASSLISLHFLLGTNLGGSQRDSRTTMSGELYSRSVSLVFKPLHHFWGVLLTKSGTGCFFP